MRIKPTSIIQAALIAVILIFASATFTGCGVFSSKKLEAGGAYAATPTTAAMPELFVADAAFKTTDDALTVVFTYELNNRAALWAISPNIKHRLDKLRDQAWEVRTQWALARATYVANPTPANLSTVNSVLAKFAQLNSVAGTVIMNKGAQ